MFNFCCHAWNVPFEFTQVNWLTELHKTLEQNNDLIRLTEMIAGHNWLGRLIRAAFPYKLHHTIIILESSLYQLPACRQSHLRSTYHDTENHTHNRLL